MGAIFELVFGGLFSLFGSTRQSERSEAYCAILTDHRVEARAATTNSIL